MTISKIRIIGKTGKEYTRKACIVEYIDDSGRQYSRAYVGNSIYRIIATDYYGKLWGII